MASSIDTNRILTQSFMTALAQAQGQWAKFCKLIDSTGVAQVTLGQGAFGGTMSTVSRTATANPSASDFFTFESDFAVAHKALVHTFPVQTRASEYAMEDLGVQLAGLVANELDAAAGALLSGLFAAAHPRAGAGAGEVGAGKKYIDTGLAFLAGEAGAGTQDNLITSALAEASLNTAIKLLLQYKSDRGVSLNLGQAGGLCLVVAPKNAQTAHELVVSALSGSDNASNFVKGLVSEIVVTNHLSDDDDWFLIDPKATPLAIAYDSPAVRLTTQTQGLLHDAVVECRLVACKAPYEPGIIGSNVA
ncbi:MAG: hypothetical protein FJ191_12670 [Gammaproteobacteria bacterium]|nr:hypothetical protein [Gammaproteobacteria bacterium]